MMISKAILTSDILDLINKIGSKMAKAEADLDIARRTGTNIKSIQKYLVEMSELRASLANTASRDKYFPDLSRNQIIEKARKCVE